jgi:hypothetical protein
MARPQNVLIGKTRGSVGDATFTVVRGINVLKAKAQNAYSNPTPTQVGNNSKFGVIVAFYRMIAALVLAGFKAGAVNGRSEYNAFMAENKYSEVVTGTSPDFVVDPELVLISKGPEFQTPLINAVKTAGGSTEIEVTWDADPSLDQQSPVYAACFNNTTGEMLASAGPIPFTNQAILLEGTGIGTNILTYITKVFYVNPATGKACDSINV